jgi:predicted Rossmann fold flavoprotein
MAGTGRQVLIIGGGASGMVAAIAAGRAGAAVTVLEKGDRVGRKLLATGNGRCNLTNVDLRLSHFHCNQPEFVRGALSRFGAFQAISFFAKLGVLAIVEEKGRVFPRSGQASAVLDALRWEMEDLGVEVRCGSIVKEVLRSENRFSVRTSAGQQMVSADAIVLATGGRAAPSLGADDSGMLVALSLGHSLVQTFPVISSLRLASPWLKHLQGTRFLTAATIRVDGEIATASFGEALFLEQGASGPAVMDVCRIATQGVRAGKTVELCLDLVPEAGVGQVRQELERRLVMRPDRPIAAMLVGYLNKRLVVPLLRAADLPDLDQPGRNLTGDQLARLALVLKDWRFPVTGSGPWSAAQATAGGIDTVDVHPDTLESRLVPGLHFAGEVLDVDGDCGGYNLQWAWASGFVAGDAAARLT